MICLSLLWQANPNIFSCVGGRKDMWNEISVFLRISFNFAYPFRRRYLWQLCSGSSQVFPFWGCHAWTFHFPWDIGTISWDFGKFLSLLLNCMKLLIQTITVLPLSKFYMKFLFTPCNILCLKVKIYLGMCFKFSAGNVQLASFSVLIMKAVV